MKVKHAKRRLQFRMRYAWCHRFGMSVTSKLRSMMREWMERKDIVAWVP